MRCKERNEVGGKCECLDYKFNYCYCGEEKQVDIVKKIKDMKKRVQTITGK